MKAFVMIVLAGMIPAALLAGAGEPCLTETTPETSLLNTLWRAGTAAGNSTDWYRNRDNDHAAIIRADYPQLNSYAIGVQDYEKNVVDAPRTIIGNASLGISGLYSMVRYWGMDSDSSAEQHYTQYRNNQHYWHPSVEIKNDTPTDRDMNIGMFPYVSQSVGKSGTELDEVRKFFHTLAAFRPEVKTKLEQEGLLIPTLQMIYRRTRVASDAAYLTGEAHPSAFDDVANNVAMIQMAQAMTTNALPPMVQIDVIEENYGGTHATKYNEVGSLGEQQFTTPASVARIFRGTEYTKRMVLSLSNSFDVNSQSLTYHVAVLRGDPSHVRITPLNAEGSLVEVEIDYHSEALVPGSARLSNLVVLGAFVDNGSYYSAPGFITSFSLFNESRIYSPDGLLQEIDYATGTIEPSISAPKSWNKDVYSHDFNGRMVGWNRQAGSTITEWMYPGFLVKGRDASGRPTLCSDIAYSLNASSKVAYTEPNLGTWSETRPCIYTNYATATDTQLTVQTASGVSSTYLSMIDAPAHGTVAILSNNGTEPKFTYTPTAGFTGVDRFILKEEKSGISSRIIFATIVVGPADTAPPTAPTGVAVYGKTSTRALISWEHTTDDVEVDGYMVYRDGTPIGTAYVTTSFTDTNLVAGTTYSYTVKAFDHAGNLSGASTAVDGSGATLWGQDNFEDGNLNADPALTKGLAWTFVSGVGKTKARTDLLPELNGNWLYIGYKNTAAPDITKLVTPNSLAAPFLIDFHDAQSSVTSDMGLLFLYQDTNNYYSLEIQQNAVALHRTLGGVTTTIGTAPDLLMQNALCSARFSVQVAVAGDAVVVDCTKSEWTTYAPATQSTASQNVQWVDTNATAAATFASGQIGFYVNNTNTYNTPYYDNVEIYALGDVLANVAPVANNQSIVIPADTATNLILTATDADSTNLTYSILASPTHGTLGSLDPNTGAVTYTPTIGYSGADSFTFRAFDGSLYSIGTISITVSAGDTAPTANFSASTISGSAPLAVTFTDTSTGTITSRVWDFGDGGTTNTTATSVAHTYTAVGTNTVQLIVSGPVGSSTNTQVNLIGVIAPPVVTGGAIVNFDLSASYNYDAYVTGEEIANSIDVDGTLGDHSLLKSVSGYAHLVDPGGATYLGIPSTTINGGEFELAAGLTGDKFGTATGTTKVNNTVARLSTDGSLATVRTATVMLEAAQQGNYSDFNVLMSANRYGTRTVTMTALIEVKYVGDATWYTAWTESQVPSAGEPGGCFGGSLVGPTGTDSHQSTAWTEVLVNGDLANGYYKSTTSASGADYMYKLAVAPTLDAGKTLEGFRFTASTTDQNRYNDFALYALSATSIGTAPGGTDDDSDGLPNDWETQYFGGATNANPAALAANGVNTIMEAYIGGLNPTNAQSFFNLSGQMASAQTILQWGAVSGRVYSVYWATNLLNGFQALETNVLYPQNSWTDVVHGAENEGFYQIKVQLEP